MNPHRHAVTAGTAFLKYNKSHPQCFLSLTTGNLFFLLSTQHPQKVVQSSIDSIVLCVSFPHRVSLGLFMMRSNTSHKNDFSPLPFTDMLSYCSLPNFPSWNRLFPLSVLCFLYPSCCWLFLLIYLFCVIFFFILCTAGSISLLTPGLQSYSVCFLSHFTHLLSSLFLFHENQK